MDYILTASATLASIILIFKWDENPGDVISLFLSISFLSFAIYRISARINNIDYGDEI